MVFLAVVTVGWVGAGAAEHVEGDLARLQGRWVAKAGHRRNIVVKLEVEGRHASVEVTTPQGVKIRGKGELRLNEGTQPRGLDWVGFSGPDGQEFPEIAAIYRIEGQTFRVCNGGPNNARPSEFRPGDGLLADVHVFERVKE
jgi:uncharacterized protein (TIGR03067 family)